MFEKIKESVEKCFSENIKKSRINLCYYQNESSEENKCRQSTL